MEEFVFVNKNGFFSKRMYIDKSKCVHSKYLGKTCNGISKYKLNLKMKIKSKHE